MATTLAIRSRTQPWDDTTENEQHGISPGTIALVLAGAAVAAGAVYFLAIGERGARNREKVLDWLRNIKDDVLDRGERIAAIGASLRDEWEDTGEGEKTKKRR